LRLPTRDETWVNCYNPETALSFETPIFYTYEESKASKTEHEKHVGDDFWL
jgi:hypothetical protein